ncbi:MAG: FkbM family methyltransferase [Gammaproteobacteria bacterium]|nr:FkbM family methyltransferase [Gammaproteobacteria bacterium]
MTKNCNALLYDTMKQKGFTPKYVAEVGVWHPDTSNIFSFIEDRVKTMLVEPDPKSIQLIKEQFNQPNVVLHEAAICDFDGQIELCSRESSTFVIGLPSSPALENDNCNIKESESFTAKAIKFSNIDNGNIDLISIDTEGSEWLVIKNMISRPSVISIETHGGIYINPYIKELKKWMANNNYTLLLKNKSDSVYVLEDTISVTVFDKINLLRQGFIITFRVFKKRISRSIKNKFGK